MVTSCPCAADHVRVGPTFGLVAGGVRGSMKTDMSGVDGLGAAEDSFGGLVVFQRFGRRRCGFVGWLLSRLRVLRQVAKESVSEGGSGSLVVGVC